VRGMDHESNRNCDGSDLFILSLGNIALSSSIRLSWHKLVHAPWSSRVLALWERYS